jgi:hypothetical protein
MIRADTILHNGTVHTLASNGGGVEAVATKDGRILAVGSETDVMGLRGASTQLIDLAGRTLVPGLIEAHGHLGIYGVIKSSVQCGSPHVRSIPELKAAIRDRVEATAPGEWVRGWGYNHNDLAEGRHPTRWDLDEVAPDHPVIVVRTCAHIAVLNSKGLELVGIDDATPDPKGGQIDREEGVVTGVLREEARRVAWEKAAPTAGELEVAIERAMRDLNALGFTSIHDMAGYGGAQLNALSNLARSRPTRLRVYQTIRAMYGNDAWQVPFLASGLVTGFGDEVLRLGPYKLVVDGASSAPTMATREPYAVDPSNSGILYVDQDEVSEVFADAHARGFQVTAHSMGDAANEICINAIEHAMARQSRPDPRHRIEHCALTDEAMLRRIKSLGIVPILNPQFLWAFGDGYVRDYGEERAGRMFQTRSLRDLGVRAAYTSDLPITDANPMFGMEIAVRRVTKSGQIVGPDERIDVATALRAYTVDAAYASFEEDVKGSIEAGKVADFTVLAADPLEVPIEELRDVPVDLTMVDGEIVYERSI